MASIKIINDEITDITEEDLISLAGLNGFNPDEINLINLGYNELKSVKFNKNTSFVNLKQLYIGNNKITDINTVKYLKNLEVLEIGFLKLNKNSVNIIKQLKKLKKLIVFNTFNDSIKDQLKNEMKIEIK